MAAERVVKVDVKAEVNHFFDDSSVVESGHPTAIILMGGVAAGKTTLRKQDYSQGYVLIDAAEIFHHLSRGDASLDFPEALREPLEIIGRLVTQRALSERRNIVTEIIGSEVEPTKQLIDALVALGYDVKGVQVTCDAAEAWQRNLNRGDNISAYYAEPFQRRWIIETCSELQPGRSKSPT
jgi:hypothetical protein